MHVAQLFACDHAARGGFADQLCWSGSCALSAQPHRHSVSFLQVSSNSIMWCSRFGHQASAWGSLCAAWHYVPEGDLLIALWLCDLVISVAKSKTTLPLR